MKKSVYQLYKMNISCMAETEKSILYLLRQQYNEALLHVLTVIDLLKEILDQLMKEESCKNQIDMTMIGNVIGDILEAKKHKDYILLADLFETRLLLLLTKIMNMLEDPFLYLYNIELLESFHPSVYNLVKEDIDARELAKNGYFVEKTEAGLMNLARILKNGKCYYHSQIRPLKEGILLANHWYDKSVKEYTIFGMGFGYAILELTQMSKTAYINIIENDLNNLRLAITFAYLEPLLNDKRIRFIYDPEGEYLKKEMNIKGHKVCLHNPSYLQITDDSLMNLIEEKFSWIKTLNEC